jgi:hypothetical protein
LRRRSDGMSVRLRNCRAAIGLLVWVALLAAQPAFAGDQRAKPSADELWRIYPLYPTVSPAPPRPGAPAADRERRDVARVPAARPASGGGRTVLIVVLGVLAAAIALGVRLRLKRTGSAGPGVAPPCAAGSLGRSQWWRSAVVEASRGAGERPAGTRRLQAAVDTPAGRFGRVVQQPPWPQGTQGRWRCEITLNAEPLSSRVQAVAYPPGHDDGHPIGTSPSSTSTSEAATDWQSPEGLERAVRALATALEAEGWEPVGQGAGWYARRFSWRREEPPPRRVEPVAAGSGGAVT